MTFDRRDIRPAMDVYTKDNVYLGTVLAIAPGALAENEQPVEGAHALGHPLQGSRVSGELLGPVPTQTHGNTGPLRQAEQEQFASASDGAALIGQGILTVGKWFGLIGKRRIPLDDVQTVSLERVVLRLVSSELQDKP